MRISGSTGIALVQCVNPYKDTYRVRWDVRPDERDYGEGNCNNYVTFLEYEFNHKPTIEEIKPLILAWYNEQIDQKILSGFAWRGYAIWLSSENQFNYKAAYDLAMQTNGANLPVVFKFGTTEQPAYYKFDTMEDLSDFYLSAMAHINLTLVTGWHEKDSIDWTQWSKYL